MPDINNLFLNNPDKANLVAYLAAKCARWIILTRHPGMTLDNCVMSSRIAYEVFKHYDLNPKPFPVAVTVGNAKYTEMLEEHGPPMTQEQLDEWVEQGAYVKGITGRRKTPASPGYWNGHLVTICEDALLDLSLDQTMAPQHGIEVEELYSKVPRGFLEGQERAVFVHASGSIVIYESEPWNDGWKGALDWDYPELYQSVVKEIIAEIEALEEPETLVRSN